MNVMLKIVIIDASPALESSESDSDGELEPPRVPPRTPSMMGLADIEQAARQSILSAHLNQPQKEPVQKKIPPPKPPRPVLLSTDSWEEIEFEKSIGEDEGPLKIVVDEDLQAGSSHVRSGHVSQISSADETRPSSSDAGNKENMSVELRPRPENSDALAEPNRVSALKASSPSSIPSGGRHRVISLIDMFESKSPSSSPPKTMTLLSRRELGRWGGARTERSNSFGVMSSRKGKSAGSVRLSTSSIESRGNYPLSDNPPVPPPKPKLSIPPLPPRPFSTECGERGVPSIPPRTPAPLLPPKPPGSKPPIIGPRMSHRRSLSDSEPTRMSPAHAPPILPPK